MVIVLVEPTTFFILDLATTAVISDFVTVFQPTQERHFFNRFFYWTYKFALCQTGKHSFDDWQTRLLETPGVR